MSAQTVRSEKGFSLIELMIVVAIIGILATIAVPNFTRFQVKARQAEAKANLSGIYTAEKAFQVEWTQYYGDFRDIGFAPEGVLKYQLGFTGVGAAIGAPFAPSTSGGVAAGGCVNTGTPACLAISGARMDTNAPAFAAAAVGNCGGVNQTGAGAVPSGAGPTARFIATANSSAAAIGGNAGTTDVWTINERRVICQNFSAI